MTVNGIIAEYNPFHNGHYYHLSEAARKTGADYTIIIMSGNYVQRGEPALLDQYTRTRMALSGGADLVLQLPLLYSLSSAELFARGAVYTLQQTGVITHLCFGAENDDYQGIMNAAGFLLSQPEAYRQELKQLLRDGYAFPRARQLALNKQSDLSFDPGLLSAPNNILAIEYCKALLLSGSPIRPVIIKRTADNYNSTDMSGQTCSALAIRNLLKAPSAGNIASVRNFIPDTLYSIFEDAEKNNRVLFPDDFSDLLYYKLLSERSLGYMHYNDVTRELSDKIIKYLNQYESFSQFCTLLKSKELTYTRISRCLFYILLGIRKDSCQMPVQTPVTYCRILGFRKRATELLSEMKLKSSLPMITKLADAPSLLSAEENQLLQYDLDASRLYYHLLSRKDSSCRINDFTTPLCII